MSKQLDKIANSPSLLQSSGEVRENQIAEQKKLESRVIAIGDRYVQSTK